MSRHVLSIGPLHVAALARELTVKTLALVEASARGGTALRVEGLALGQLELDVGARGDGAHVQVDGLVLEGVATTGQVGLAGGSAALDALDVAQLSARRVELSVARIDLAAQLVGLRLSTVSLREAELGAGASAHVSIASASADVALDIAAVPLRGRVELRGVRLDLTDDGVGLACQTAWVSGLAIERPDLVVRAAEVALPGGLSLHPDGQLSADALHSERVELELELTSSASAPAPAAAAAADAADDDDAANAASAAVQAAQRAAQLEALDALLGDIDIECDVDATLPIVGRRRARHHFALPIIDGAIEYRALEHGLSALEDAALDFELVGDQLVLEKDVIPVVTFDNETLLSWPLDASGQAMARAGRVRLRTLLAPQVHVSLGGDADAPPPLRLHSLDVHLRAVTLEHAGVARLPLGRLSIALGDGTSKGIEALAIGGAMSQRESGPPPPGELRVDCAAIVGALHHLDVGGRLLAAAAVELRAIRDGQLAFDGLRPRRLKLAGAVRARSVTLR